MVLTNTFNIDTLRKQIENCPKEKVSLTIKRIWDHRVINTTNLVKKEDLLNDLNSIVYSAAKYTSNGKDLPNDSLQEYTVELNEQYYLLKINNWYKIVEEKPNINDETTTCLEITRAERDTIVKLLGDSLGNE